MGRRSTTSVLLAWLFATLAACASRAPTVQEMSDRLRAELSPGDSMQRVEQVLTSAGVVYVYDGMRNRYEGKLPESRRYSEQWNLRTRMQLAVTVHLDADHKFKELEVEEIIAGQ